MTKLGSLRFLEKAKELVIDYFNREVEKTDRSSIESGLDGDVVWYCNLLGNHKCLISTTVPDGMYYEVTYDSNTGEIYLDAYKKWKSECHVYKGEI
nr:MAG TPA: hypothetical protein [Caudoviricetes sp.]